MCLQDGMFEVDVKEMRMVPVFWTHKGNNIPVRRGRWFFDEKRPCPEEMCDELEEGYECVSPAPLSLVVLLSPPLAHRPSCSRQADQALGRASFLSPFTLARCQFLTRRCTPSLRVGVLPGRAAGRARQRQGGRGQAPVRAQGV